MADLSFVEAAEMISGGCDSVFISHKNEECLLNLEVC